MLPGEEPRRWSRLWEDTQLASTQCIDDTWEDIFLALQTGQLMFQGLNVKLWRLRLSGHKAHGNSIEAL